MGGDEKTGDEEKWTSKAMSFDLNDFTVIKEGEAEILMHAKNEVFYNKTQGMHAMHSKASEQTPSEEKQSDREKGSKPHPREKSSVEQIAV